MIAVRFVRDSSGSIRQFSVKGHAGYDERGRDIVCAAASVTAYTAAGALEELAGLSGCHTESDGRFFCSIPGELTPSQRKTADIILETALIGFRQIEHAYGDFIRVFEEEV